MFTAGMGDVRRKSYVESQRISREGGVRKRRESYNRFATMEQPDINPRRSSAHHSVDSEQVSVFQGG